MESDQERRILEVESCQQVGIKSTVGVLTREIEKGAKVVAEASQKASDA